MSTPNASRSPDAVSIVLTPAQAKHVATCILANAGFELDGMFNGENAIDGLRTREQFENIRGLLADAEARLDAIAWGNPPEDVTLAMHPELWEDIVSHLFNHADYAANLQAGDNHKLGEAREDLRATEAGIAVWDQLQAPHDASEQA